MTATLCGGPAMDSRMSVFCNSSGAMTCVGGNDDTCSFRSQVAFCTQETGIYYILVHGYTTSTFGPNQGAFQISLSDDSTPCSGGILCLPTGACCTANGCSITTENGCGGAGGSYLGDNTTCGTFSSVYGDPSSSVDTFPIAIADNATSTSTLTVADVGSVGGVQVCIGLTHTFVGDLVGTISHGSRSARLFNRQGGGADLGGTYCFGSVGTIVFAGGTPAGVYSSFDSLAAFIGDTTNGTWTLTVADQAGGDIGSIDSFDIRFSAFNSNCSSCPACAADYNSDGGVDGADIGAFFPDWESSAACADVNQDGGVDGADIEAFFNVWQAGGC
jgi:subtilisin-like proprotein convertase family protein